MAAMYGHYEVAEVLLEAGISRDARTKVDKSPLHLAATEGFTNIVELLLMNRADVNGRDMVGGSLTRQLPRLMGGGGNRPG